MAVLPIGQKTLRYGSGDSGKTVHKDIPDLNRKMKAAAKLMNIKGNTRTNYSQYEGHITGLFQKEKIYGPGDIGTQNLRSD
jgi:hypothetical protein